MSKLFVNIFHSMYHIRLAFSGIFISNNEVPEAMKEDIQNLDIPLFDADRENFRKDRENVARDFNRSLKEKKAQLQL